MPLSLSPRLSGTLSLLALGTACGTTRSNLTPATASRLGVYRFVERIPSHPPLLLEGEFSVRGDSILFNAEPGPCRYDEQNSTGRLLTYICGGVSYMFDRSDPVERLSYQSTAIETVPARVCTRMDSRDVCVAWRTDFTEKTVTRSGRLRPKRVR